MGQDPAQLKGTAGRNGVVWCKSLAVYCDGTGCAGMGKARQFCVACQLQGGARPAPGSSQPRGSCLLARGGHGGVVQLLRALAAHAQRLANRGEVELTGFIR